MAKHMYRPNHLAQVASEAISAQISGNQRSRTFLMALSIILGIFVLAVLIILAVNIVPLIELSGP